MVAVRDRRGFDVKKAMAFFDEQVYPRACVGQMDNPLKTSHALRRDSRRHNFGHRIGSIIWLFALLMCATVAPSAKADTIAYNFVGTLMSGADSVSGTFALDFTNTTIPSFDFATPIGVFSSHNDVGKLFQYSPAYSPHSDFIHLAFNTATGRYMYLDFQLSLSQFHNAGGPLYALKWAPQPYTDTIAEVVCLAGIPGPGCVREFIVPFAQGQATAVPEPSSLLLLGTGLLGVVARKVRRFGVVAVVRPLGTENSHRSFIPHP